MTKNPGNETFSKMIGISEEIYQIQEGHPNNQFLCKPIDQKRNMILKNSQTKRDTNIVHQNVPQVGRPSSSLTEAEFSPPTGRPTLLNNCNNFEIEK
ncbi:hypothetical protein H6P81_003237 [Aristolochia fimbriata]|uniref:Uncharacterized protein n=1 Tax=Aristolochia fimbriata TaxID=158543 RepID=A0AAV7FCK6_ARIFI|nr:hypothetical protein H6P81_003237 [Aristolochia fimbriata]